MRYAFAAIAISGALSIPAVAAFAATPEVESLSVEEGSQTSVAGHATRGTVKSIDATTLVIARARDRGEMTFQLTPSIHRQGTVVVGTTVSVRYQDDGTKHVATAITVDHPDRPRYGETGRCSGVQLAPRLPDTPQLR